MSSTTLNIALLNVQSIQNKSFSINNYISANKIDILCLNETWLKQNDSHLNLMKDYIMLRHDRLSRGGGVAIIINRIISHKLLSSKSTRDYEYIAIEISNNNEKIILLNSYTHPKSKSNFNFISQLLKKSSGKMIVVGDFNATHHSWFCNSSNKRGIELENVLSENNIMVLNKPIPTSRKSSNIIDLISCTDNLTNKINEIEVDEEFDISDHWLVKFKLKFEVSKYLINIVNWINFKVDLDKVNINDFIGQIHSNSDLDNCAEKVSALIHNCVTENTIQVEKKPQSIRIPPHIFLLIKSKKKLQRAFSKSHDAELKPQINKLSNQIKKFTLKAHNENWNEICSFLAEKKPSETTFWKLIKQVETGNIPKDTTVLPNVKSKVEKVKTFGRFYKETFSNPSYNPNINRSDLFSYLGDDDFSAPININEIKECLKSTKATKSTGVDNISNKTIKNLPDNMLNLLANVYNYSLTLSYVPCCWKIAKIKVLKKKDKELDNPASYRPISLLNTIGRVLEKVINSRLYKWAGGANLLHNNQSGFRKHHSTQDNIFKLIESCKNGIQIKKICGLVLFDIEKAFDKAPHIGILSQLDKLKCPRLLGLWLCSFLSERNFLVDLDGTQSECYSITAGVPQGSPLSPLLFSLFINEIGYILERFDLDFALFADDLTIWKIDKDISNINSILQTASTEVYSFFNNIGLNLNTTKCEYSIFSNIRKALELNLVINGIVINYSANPKILGIHFDKKLNFIFHFDVIKKQLVSKINLLRILSFKSNRISTNNLLSIYKSLILSKIQYSMLPFMVTPNKIKNQLQVIQNKCLKTITNLHMRTSSRLIHQTLGIQKLDLRIANLCCNYIAKAKNNNKTVKYIIDSHEDKPINRSKSKRSILDRLNMTTVTPNLSTTQFGV
jgi:exonuclease III